MTSRWLAHSAGLMAVALLVALPSSVYAAEAPAPNADEGDYSLTVSFQMRGTSLEKISPVALSRANPPALSTADEAVVDRSLTRLAEACGSDPEIAEVLFAAAPDRALRQFTEAFPRAKVEARQEMARLAVTSDLPAAEAVLVRALLDGNEDVRMTASAVIEREKRPYPSAALLAAFATARPDAIVRALGYVGVQGDEALVPALRPYVTHREAEIRAKAVARLAEIGGRAAVDELRKALSDGSHIVRQPALRGLAKLHALTPDDVLIAVRGAKQEVLIAAFESMPETDNEALRQMVLTACQDKSADLRAAAATALGRCGNPADLSLLILRLRTDQEEKVRAAAARAYGSHRATVDLAPLLTIAADSAEKSSTVKEAVGQGLAATPAGVQTALSRLQPGGDAWGGFVSAICHQEAPRAEVLAAIISAQSAESRESHWADLAETSTKLPPADKYRCYALLLERGDGYGQDKVISLLKKDSSPEARATLRAACAYPNLLPRRGVAFEWDYTHLVDGRGYITGSTRYENIWELALAALSEAEKEDRDAARSALLATAVGALSDKDSTVRAGAVRVISASAPKENAALLIAATKDPDASVRTVATEALISLPPSDLVEPLTRLAGDPDGDVRKAAALVVVSVGAPELLPAARKLSEDANSSVKQVGLIALAVCSGRMEEVMAAAPVSHSHSEQESLVTTLAALPPAEAASALAKLVAGKDDDLSVKAMEKLYGLASAGKLEVSAAERALGPILGGASESRKLVAACTLAALHSPLGLDALLRLPASGGSALRLAMGAQLGAGGAGGKLFSPDGVRLVIMLGFRKGYETSYNMATTHLFVVPCTVSRAGKFEPGDRWPLDQTPTLASALDPVLLALASYSDPRATAKLREAAAARAARSRRTALWGMALRDDRLGVEAFLADRDRATAEDAVTALRLLGHRASIPALAARVGGSNPAAMAVVETGLPSKAP